MYRSLASAQENKVDSLLLVVKTTPDDTVRISALNGLFLEYEFTDDKKAGEYLNRALELAVKVDYKRGLANTYTYFGYFAEDKGDNAEALKNYLTSLKFYTAIGDKKGEADTHNNIGIVYTRQGNYPEALKNYYASLKIIEASGSNEDIGTKISKANTYSNIGIIYREQGNYPEALKNSIMSLKIRESIPGGDKAGVAQAYNTIGNVYVNQGNYPEALKSYLASLKMSETIGDKKGMAYSYNNIGILFKVQGNYSEALKNYSACLEIMKEMGSRAGMASAHNNIGLVYLARAEMNQSPALRENMLNAALENHNASLKIKEEIGDKAGISLSYNNIGNVYTKLKKYAKAEEFLTKAVKLSKEIGYKEYLKEAYRDFTNLDSARGNFKGAYENHKLYILYRDSLDNEQTRKKTIQSQMTFDFEKKEAIAEAEHKKELENQEVLAEEKSRKQKIIILFVVIGLILVLVFAGFVFRSLSITRKQKRVIEDQKDIVELQKKEVEQQKNIVEEHQKEIIDSIKYARRIQRSLLPTEKYIEKTLNRLKIKRR